MTTQCRPASKDHPETREGEIYLGNGHESDFVNMIWKTKRLGRVPYDRDGKPTSTGSSVTNRFLPMFAMADELRAAGHDPDNLYPTTS